MFRPPLSESTTSFEFVTVDATGRVIARQAASARVLTEHLSDDVALELIAIPDGEARIGSPPGEGFDDERPRHRVQVPAFALGRAPVTQAQWQAVMGTLPPCRDVAPELPVHRVAWDDARAFCRRLSSRTGRHYRLPGEAEWELACRAGTTTPFYTGPTLTTDLANYVGLHTYAQEPEGLYRHRVTEAGCFPPNPFGFYDFYDMHGNVWEWCADAWHTSYEGAPTDGRAWESTSRARAPRGRVLRGGCWHDPPNLCRSATRLRSDPNEPEDYFGLRVALVLDAPEKRRNPRMLVG